MLNKIKLHLIVLLSALTLLATTAIAGHHGDGKKMEQMQDIVAVASGNSSFTTLVAALKAGDLVGTLQGDGPFTVFAPTDEAFAKLPKGTLKELLMPENKDKLISILTYHVVPGKVYAKDVSGLSAATTVQGSDIAIATDSGNVKINNATVVGTDIKASNGVIHVIDTVILPTS